MHLQTACWIIWQKKVIPSDKIDDSTSAKNPFKWFLAGVLFINTFYC